MNPRSHLILVFCWSVVFAGWGTGDATRASGQESQELQPAEVVPDVTLVVDHEQRYEVGALLAIHQRRPHIFAPQPDLEDGERFQRTQINILRSRIVLDRVISDPQIATLQDLQGSKDPLEYLERHLRVVCVDNDSELYEIIFSGKTPESAALVANAVLDAYVRIRTEIEAQQSQQVVDFLEKEMDRRTREWERLRQSIRALTKIIQRDTTQGPDAQLRPDAETLQPMWQQAWREELELTARLAALEELIAADPDAAEQAVSAAEVQQDPSVAELAQHLQAAKEELGKVQGLKPERAAKFRPEIEQRVAKLQGELALRTELARDWHAAQRQRARETERNQERARLKLELATKRHVVARLSTLLSEQSAARERNANHELDLEFLRQDLERSEAMYNSIAERAEALKTNMRSPVRVGEMRRARADEAVPVLAPLAMPRERS